MVLDPLLRKRTQREHLAPACNADIVQGRSHQGGARAASSEGRVHLGVDKPDQPVVQLVLEKARQLTVEVYFIAVQLRVVCHFDCLGLFFHTLTL